ncbi:MAG: purine-nucleoside phosphorylase [Eubacterium sp.]|nr:purine-nucleoside phosphorylase [Eubacterium sp.]
MFDKQIEYIKSRVDFTPEIAVVLGSGLGGFAKSINTIAEITYSEIEGMPVSTAPSHAGKFIFGEIGGKKVVAMQGRVHLYEGYTPQQIAMPIRLMRLLGADKLILTNAAGGINKNFNCGDFMMITDHIASFVPSPLVGKNIGELGVRFPDMSNAYSKKLQKIVKSVSNDYEIPIKQGVYAQLAGPQFETPAEIKMLSTIGADAVGMSTAIEAIAAVHCGFEVCGISLITNLACGILDKPLTSEEVTETAERVAPDFEKLLSEVIKAI